MKAKNKEKPSHLKRAASPPCGVQRRKRCQRVPRRSQGTARRPRAPRCPRSGSGRWLSRGRCSRRRAAPRLGAGSPGRGRRVSALCAGREPPWCFCPAAAGTEDTGLASLTARAAVPQRSPSSASSSRRTITAPAQALCK